MKADAASAGFYEGQSGKKFPRLQLLTVGGLLDGTERVEHPDYVKNVNFKKAPKTTKRAETKRLALDDDD